MDISTLCEHICVCQSTVETWVKQGVLPPPKMRGGKRMWKWKDVDSWLDGNAPGAASYKSAEDLIRTATKAATIGPHDASLFASD